MAIRVTERLESKMTFAQPFTASRAFDVSGVTHETDALLAIDALDATMKIPQARDAHPRNVALVCAGPRVRDQKGPDYWVIDCQYDFIGSALPAGIVNPLSLPVEYSWGTIKLTEPSDTDATGRLVCNSAGDVTPVPQPYALKTLRARKAFTTFSTAWWAMENTKNQSPVNIDGITVAAEHMVCEAVVLEPYYKGATLVYFVNFEFTICLGAMLGQARFPFDHRLLDAGTSGWYDDSGTKRKARFSNGKGVLLDEPIYLDGSGLAKSAFSFAKVGETNKTIVTPPAPYAPYDVDTATVYPNAVYRYFEKYAKAEHNALPCW